MNFDQLLITVGKHAASNPIGYALSRVTISAELSQELNTFLVVLNVRLVFRTKKKSMNNVLFSTNLTLWPTI